MSLLSCQGVSINLGSSRIVNDVSMTLEQGELVGLIGPNGAGKSTLLQAIASVCPVHAGQIDLHAKPLRDYSPEQRAQLVAWLAQNGPVNWPLSVERLVALGRTPHQRTWQQTSQTDYGIIERILSETDCQSLRYRNVSSLSGGERARVLMARALAGEPTVLLADEPVAALDLAHQLQTMELLRCFASEHRACLVVLHDLSLAARFCDRLLLMDKGILVRSGPVKHVLTEESLRTVYGVEAEIGQTTVPWILPIKRV